MNSTEYDRPAMLWLARYTVSGRKCDLWQVIYYGVLAAGQTVADAEARANVLTALVLPGGVRGMTRFVQCASRVTAKRHCPWAVVLAKVEGGFLCFASAVDFQTWKGQV